MIFDCSHKLLIQLEFSLKSFYYNFQYIFFYGFIHFISSTDFFYLTSSQERANEYKLFSTFNTK